MTTADVLRGAAEIVHLGWCQGAQARTKRGRGVRGDDPAMARCCAAIAICRAAGPPYTAEGSGPARLAWDALIEYLDLPVLRYQHCQPAAYYTIADWNDDPARRKAQVVKALLGAAAATEEAP